MNTSRIRTALAALAAAAALAPAAAPQSADALTKRRAVAEATHVTAERPTPLSRAVAAPHRVRLARPDGSPLRTLMVIGEMPFVRR